MLQMRLVLVKEVDFRKSEATNYDELKKHEKELLSGSNVICFYSQSGNQIVFIHKPAEINFADFGKRAGTATLHRSERLRLSHRTFDALMLQNYAEAVGLHLEGIRRFEEFMGHLAKATARAEKMEERRGPKKKGGKVIPLRAVA